MKRLPSLLLLVILLHSCKKDKFYKESLTGIALHYITKLPLVNQSVTLTVNSITIGPKNDEFPNGMPVYTSTKYYAVTDNTGHFTFPVKIDANASWRFSIALQTGEYAQKLPDAFTGVIYIPANDPDLALDRMHYDTIWGEKPAYVRYHVKNINDTYINDTLKLSTYHTTFPIASTMSGIGSFFVLPDEYNWHFNGIAVDRVVADTIPGESVPQIPVKWLYKRTDTITFKNETINVSPNTTSDYYINY
jgi:hypothetical protein